ncbi:unnamed protein product [Soboliphyme baturini]|uniref:AMP-binding domain-containing protein n=1 Tax=Soboliphyme baturini TaxID=241478 RepID=A0A183IQL6_9BILA|nr:unnamed protein product [Soboliphyme baturini]
MVVWKCDRIVKNYHVDVITNYIIRNLSNYGDRVALHEWETGRKLTFVQLHDFIYSMAANLRRHGLAKGDVLLVQLPNCIEYVIAYYATVLAGGMFASIPAQSTAEFFVFNPIPNRDSYYEPFNSGDCVVCAMAMHNGYSQHAVMHLAMKQATTMVILRKYAFSKLLDVVSKCAVSYRDVRLFLQHRTMAATQLSHKGNMQTLIPLIHNRV